MLRGGQKGYETHLEVLFFAHATTASTMLSRRTISVYWREDMEPEAAAEWVLKRACGPYRKNGACEHKGCIEAKEIHDMLKSAIRVNEQISNGEEIKGWLIPD